MRYDLRQRMEADGVARPMASSEMRKLASARGVTIEASHTVGEYDILILSASQSDGLVRWLDENDYRIPKGAQRVVESNSNRTCASSLPG